MKKVVWFTTTAAAVMATLLATPTLSIKLQASDFGDIVEEEHSFA